MRRVLKNMFGTETGFSFPSGEPVLVGERLSIKGVDVPATVRVRVAKLQLYYYVTYSLDGVTYSRPLRQVVEEGFTRCTVPKYTKPAKEPELPAPPKRSYILRGCDGTLTKQRKKGGDYILMIEEYDIAIYGNYEQAKTTE